MQRTLSSAWAFIKTRHFLTFSTDPEWKAFIDDYSANLIRDLLRLLLILFSLAYVFSKERMTNLFALLIVGTLLRILTHKNAFRTFKLLVAPLLLSLPWCR